MDSANAYDSDAFVAKYDSDGNMQWVRQLDSPLNGTQRGDGVSADGFGNVYISGSTNQFLNGPYAGGAEDAFVAKYDDDGNFLWVRTLGTPVSDYSKDVSADGLGNVYITGVTLGNLGGPIAGPSDAFLSKYDGDGNLLDTKQLGTAAADPGFGVSADGLGSIYITGGSGGSLGGPNAGSDGTYDAYVAKYSDPIVPEPASWLLTVSGGVVLTWIARRSPRGWTR